MKQTLGNVPGGWAEKGGTEWVMVFMLSDTEIQQALRTCND